MTPAHPTTADRTDDLCQRLAIACLLLSGDIAAIVSAARAPFARHLPNMEPPEEDILRMLLFEARPAKQIAASLHLPETDVLGWAALGLVRLFADIPIPAMEALHS